MTTDKPIQYIRGFVEFYKLKFKVTPEVLIPRPETELLVDEVLAQVKASQHPEERKSDEGSILVLDVGTGAGAIAISVAKNTKNVKVIATDFSASALEVARLNAKYHRVEDRITFIESDLLENPLILTTNYQILILVTNLPYIPTSRISYLDSSVKDFEPHVALDGGEDGFELYRKLFEQINQKDWQPKLIIGEIDYTHGELALSEAQKYFPDADCQIKLDLSHKQRILEIRFN